MPRFAVHLKGSGHVIPVLADSIGFADEKAKIDSGFHAKSIRVVKFDGFRGIDGHLFIRSLGGDPSGPSADKAMGAIGDFPDYYFIKASAVAAMYTLGAQGPLDHESVPLGDMHAWLVVLERTGVYNSVAADDSSSWQSDTINVPACPLILAKKFRIGYLPSRTTEGVAVTPRRTKQAATQLGVRFENYLGYTTFGRLNAPLPMLYEAETADLAYYFPLESVAAIVPMSANITELQAD